MADLSKVSTEDLLAYKQGNMSAVSTEGLMALRGIHAQSKPDPNFFERVSRNFEQRAAMERGLAEKAVAGKKTEAEALGEIALSSVGGPISDVIGAALEPTIKAAAPYVPQPVKDVAGKVSEAYQQIPERGRDIIEAAGNALNLVGGGAASKPLAVGAIKAAPIVGKAVAEVPAVVGKGAAAALAPNIPKETAVLAKRAVDLGIDLRLDQISPTRARKSIQKISQDLPFSGVDASEAANKIAWNRGVARTIGQESDSLGPETIQKFQADAASKFNSAIGVGDFKVTGSDFQKIKSIEENLPKNVTEDIAKIVKSHTEQFRKDLTPVSSTKTVPAGVDEFGMAITKTVKTAKEPIISSQKLASLRSDLIQSLPKIDPKAKSHVSELIDIIDDIAERNISPENIAKLKQARREWRNFKTIEPLLEKSTDGLINPTDLMQRVASSKYIKASKTAVGEDDLVDLARIGKQFLVKAGGSDTVAKSVLVGGSAAGTAALLGHPLALLTEAAVLGANRGFQAINKSKTIRDLAIKKGLNE